MSEAILLFGKDAYLAREFASRHGDLPLRLAAHDAIGDDALFEGVGCVVNFAFHPDLHAVEYAAAQDVDARLGHAAAARGAHYVMMSSRKAYSRHAQWRAAETAETAGMDAYGRNKAHIEGALRSLLGDDLTILRPGNVIGFEYIAGRPQSAWRRRGYPPDVEPRGAARYRAGRFLL